MNEQDILNRLQNLETKIDSVYISVEKTRKYILIVTIATVVAFVLPLILLAFAIPSFLNTFSVLGTI